EITIHPAYGNAYADSGGRGRALAGLDLVFVDSTLFVEALKAKAPRLPIDILRRAGLERDHASCRNNRLLRAIAKLRFTPLMETLTPILAAGAGHWRDWTWFSLIP
ncbi:hypothetical protein BHG04_29105, partial [Klebsiella pneumoniae]